jgi:outer membrane protein OmpA-like peptidoglycan-associated protein
MNAGNRRLLHFFCFIVLFLLTGCAGQKSLVVLLPEDGKPSGEVTVETPGGSVVLSHPWQAVEISGGNVQPAAPVTMEEPAVKEVFAEVVAAMPAPPVRYTLYFRQNTAVLTKDSQRLLPEIIKAINKRRPAQLSVIGHTDTMGTEEYNYQLGLLRANTVTNLLKSLGAAPAIIEASSHGKTDLIVKTGDQVAEQRNRRVEVTIR